MIAHDPANARCSSLPAKPGEERPRRRPATTAMASQASGPLAACDVRARAARFRSRGKPRGRAPARPTTARAASRSLRSCTAPWVFRRRYVAPCAHEHEGRDHRHRQRVPVENPDAPVRAEVGEERHAEPPVLVQRHAANDVAERRAEQDRQQRGSLRRRRRPTTTATADRRCGRRPRSRCRAA